MRLVISSNLLAFIFPSNVGWIELKLWVVGIEMHGTAVLLKQGG